MGRKYRTIETDFLGLEVSGTGKINSKLKGNKNELECAKMLEEWTGVRFARVPSSGGLRWANTANACGDLICEDQDFDFPFAVETKHLKSLTITATLRKNSQILSIYQQAIRDAIRASKCPMMCLRSNGMKKRSFIIFVPFYLHDHGVVPLCTGEGPIYGYDSDDLLKNVNFEQLRERGNIWNNRKYKLT